MKSKLLVLILPALIILTGCASVISNEVLKEVKEEASLPQVQSSPEKYTNKKVIWGGIILTVENLEDKTVIEVFKTHLTKTHTPTNTAEDGGGRFLIEASGYLDTFIYRQDKMITVAGIIKGIEKKKVGKMDYPYPVVTPLEMHLFEPIYESEYQEAAPWWYYPHYDPYWPYYWPYYPWWAPFPPP